MGITEELVAIMHPMPAEGDVPDELFSDACRAVAEEREATATNLELQWDADGGDGDPVLSAIAAARRQRDAVEEEIRRLIAYGREFTRPRPYTLADLADAAGMSISGVRTAYDHDHVEAVAREIRRPAWGWRATDTAGTSTT